MKKAIAKYKAYGLMWLLLMLPAVTKADGMTAMGTVYISMVATLAWLTANVLLGFYFLFRHRKGTAANKIRLVINIAMTIYFSLTTEGYDDTGGYVEAAIFALVLIVLIAADCVIIYRRIKKGQ